ncbi:putative vacuolar ATP synthase subunit d [Cardiosporidium cionae]|uniref:V-type proton ATPase subunit n=1 Tax=Cardiosporidium cionae TaxID=476202 RepID=A0ABQ7JGK8_9APIC|nr:putative vacuolar ATP synthase subunit d [Cardiosporidium cionae]|eukprot:KAF8823084.1 putative vacuolar ATP synthase subunit d [Cardiosporidium cionae]
MAELAFFNVRYGYLEGICRGLRSGFLTQDDYRRLAMSETMEDLRSALEDTDYGPFLQNEPLPLAATTIDARLRERMAAEFRYMHAQADEELSKFMNFILLEKMIDNVIGLIQGTRNNRSAEEMIARLDPMGWFPGIKHVASLNLGASHQELYRTLLLDSPVGPYFETFLETMQAEGEGRTMTTVVSIFGEVDTEILRNILKKAWIEEFYDYVLTLSGTTREVMEHILKSEADFRVLSVTLNSINTSLGDSTQLHDRNSLYPSLGYLYPQGTERIRRAWNDATLQSALQPMKKYSNLYEQCKAFYVRNEMGELNTIGETSRYKSLEDLLFAEIVSLCEDTFERQFHFGIFYAWVKLKEQEIRNIIWVSEMVNYILMQQKDYVDNIVPIFARRV